MWNRAFLGSYKSSSPHFRTIKLLARTDTCHSYRHMLCWNGTVTACFLFLPSLTLDNFKSNWWENKAHTLVLNHQEIINVLKKILAQINRNHRKNKRVASHSLSYMKMIHLLHQSLHILRQKRMIGFLIYFSNNYLILK